MATQQKFEKLEFNFTPYDHFVDDDERAKILKALAKEGSVADAATALGVKNYVVSHVRHIDEVGLIPFRNQSELQKKIVKEREKGESWARIGARAGGMTEGRVQSLYEEETGESHEKADIGKGGRPKGNGDGGGKKTASKSKSKSTKSTTSKSKKAPAKKKAAPKKSDARPFADVDPDGLDDDDITEQLEGATVTVERPGGKTAEVEIVKIEDFATNKKGERGIKVLDVDSKNKTFALNKIVSVN